ncbi:carbohydrate ABC transporter permease [Kineococcus sp. SYSU DK002]|uniref:carbohydrate ABC transporter permease n=1 Tax=Kineococcus sp. SYSU DK002 TaxID=3383123 RepID=UPI003D7E21A1
MSRFTAAVKYSSLVAVCVALLLPLVTMVFAAFKTGPEYSSTSAFTPPRDWLNFANFQRAFSEGDMLRGTANTALVLLVSIAGTILLGTAAAYAIDRFDFRFKKAVLALFLVASLIPSVTTQVSVFQIVNSLGLFNTRGAAVVLFVGTDIVAIYVFLQFLAAIPRSIDEAARLDGAGHFRIYWLVILPLLRPAIATVVIIKAVAVYNEFYVPFLYMPSPRLAVISTSLFRFKSQYSADWEVISAGVILVTIPALVTFLALQRVIYRGLAAGAVK